MHAKTDHFRSSNNGIASASDKSRQAIVGNLVHIVRRALCEECEDTKLHRRIISEARRAGFVARSGMIVGETLIHTVARRLAACLAAGVRTPDIKSRGAEETVRD